MTATFDQKQLAWLNTSIISHTSDIMESVAYYPNPVIDALHITTSVPYQYQIVYILGQQLLSGTSSDGGPIDVSSLSPGIYIMTLSFPQGPNHTLKFIKQ
jgi:hypothetical protein